MPLVAPIEGHREPLTGEPQRLPDRRYRNVGSAVYLFAVRVLASAAQLHAVGKVWGGDYTGLNALSNQVVLVVTMLELGLAQSATSLLFVPIASGNHEDAGALLAAVRHDVRRLTAAGLILVPAALAAYACTIHTTVPRTIVTATLQLVGLSGLLQLSSLPLQVYLNAAERIDRVNYVFGTGYLLKTALGLLIATATRQYLWLPATIALLTVLEVAALRIACHGLVPEVRQGEWRGAARTIRARARFALIHKIGGLAYYQTDFIILSLTTSLLVVRDYAQYQYVSSALLSMMGMIAAALTSSLARRQSESPTTERRAQYAHAQLAACVAAFVIALGYCFTAPVVVRLAFGRGENAGGLPVPLFALALLLNIIKTTDDTFVAAQGAFQAGFWLPLIEVPVYLVLGTALSRNYGITGLLAASIVCNLLVPTVARGLVLARPVFLYSVSHWFRIRLRNTATALAYCLPIALLHLGGRSLIRNEVLRATVIDLAAAIYATVVICRVLRRGFGYGSARR